jgi:hypothetical protein
LINGFSHCQLTCCFESVAAQYTTTGAHSRVNLFTSWLGAKERKKKGRVPQTSLRKIPSIRRSSNRPCLLKFPPSPTSAKLENKSLTHGGSFQIQAMAESQWFSVLLRFYQNLFINSESSVTEGKDICDN